MSHYTTELRFYCETLAGLDHSEGYTQIETILDKAVPRIFDFDVPLFDPLYSNVLFRKILKHYYTREIGFETIALWKFKLNVKLNEIMPYYNQLYKSELLKFDPFLDTNYTKHYNRQHDGTQNIDAQVNDNSHTSTQVDVEDTSKDVYGDIAKTVTNTTTDFKSDSESHGKLGEDRTTNVDNTTKTNAEESTNTTDLYSDTPQGTLINVTQGKYLTNARVVNSNKESTTDQTGHTTDISNVDQATTSTNETTNKEISNSTTDYTDNSTRDINATSDQHTDSTFTNTQTTQHDTTIKNLEDYFETITGKTNGGASYSQLLNEFRETFLNIDLMVIEELDELFFMLW